MNNQPLQLKSSNKSSQGAQVSRSTRHLTIQPPPDLEPAQWSDTMNVEERLYQTTGAGNLLEVTTLTHSRTCEHTCRNSKRTGSWDDSDNSISPCNWLSLYSMQLMKWFDILSAICLMYTIVHQHALAKPQWPHQSLLSYFTFENPIKAPWVRDILVHNDKSYLI